MHGSLSKLAQAISLTNRSAIWNICSGKLKVKVTLKSQMIKRSYIELVRAKTSVFMHGHVFGYTYVRNTNEIFLLFTNRTRVHQM